MKTSADVLACLACIIAAVAIVIVTWSELRGDKGISASAKAGACFVSSVLTLAFLWGAWRLGWLIAGDNP